jgi:hypothetical protein
MAVASAYDLNSEITRIAIPQKGQEERTLDTAAPARWNRHTKLDDSGALWDFIQNLEKVSSACVYDISLTADSADGQQNLEYSGALDGGYGPAALQSVANKLQDIVSGGGLRMSVGSIGFPTGQALLDWLKATKQPFDASKVTQ